jgi:hypothetical protein
MQEQAVERIHTHLDWTVCRLEQYLWERRGESAGKRRIRLDAALIAVLTIVAELLPGEIQEQVKQMVTLHDEVCRLEIEEQASLTSS